MTRGFRTERFGGLGAGNPSFGGGAWWVSPAVPGRLDALPPEMLCDAFCGRTYSGVPNWREREPAAIWATHRTWRFVGVGRLFRFVVGRAKLLLRLSGGTGGSGAQAGCFGSSGVADDSLRRSIRLHDVRGVLCHCDWRRTFATRVACATLLARHGLPTSKEKRVGFGLDRIVIPPVRRSQTTLCGHTGVSATVTPTTTASWAIGSHRPSHKWGAPHVWRKQWA